MWYIEDLEPLLAEFEKLKTKYISLCERRDKLEQIVRIHSAQFSDTKIFNTTIRDKFAFYLENKFFLKLDKKIAKSENKLKKLKGILQKFSEKSWQKVGFLTK